jgi:hypothetical protein
LDLPVALYIIAAGLAWVIGYLVQDFLSLFPIVSTAHVSKPGRFVKFLYRQFTKIEWQDISAEDITEAEIYIDEHASAKSSSNFERIIILRLAGTAIGSSGMLSSVFLAGRAISSYGTIFDVALVSAALVLSSILLILSWIKGAQQAQQAVKLSSSIKLNKAV